MAHSAIAVANFFIRKGVDSRSPVDPMKLQKLVYFAHGWHLAIHGEPLIDEMPEAWRYGPVIPSIYHQVKRNGSARIIAPIDVYEPGIGRYTPEFQGRDEVIRLLERVWSIYGGLDAVELSRMTHDHDGPWAKTWENEAESGNLRGVDIPNGRIREYFVRAAKKNRGAGAAA